MRQTDPTRRSFLRAVASRHVDGHDAVTLGLVDEAVPHQTVRDRGIALAGRVGRNPPRRTRDIAIVTPPPDLLAHIEAELK